MTDDVSGEHLPAFDRSVTSPLVGTSIELWNTNRSRGQVVDIALTGSLDPPDWDALQARLLTLIEVRQMSELRLDLDGAGGVTRFPEGLQEIAEALAAIGGTLTLASGPAVRGDE